MAEVQSGVAETIKILITDRIAREGIELLRTQLPQAQIDEQPGIKQEQLKAIIGEYHALIVRSETQVTGDILTAATRLKIVGRAGVGVDNIDTETATRQGIVVVNARKVGVTMLSMEDVLRQADFVTLHTSLTSGPHSTRGLIGTHELHLLKPGARLINCARGGLIDEEALLNALNENQLAGAALDVFSQEPVRDDAILKQLVAHERVIATPHLGASTEEAQVGVATDVAEQV